MGVNQADIAAALDYLDSCIALLEDYDYAAACCRYAIEELRLRNYDAVEYQQNSLLHDIPPDVPGIFD